MTHWFCYERSVGRWAPVVYHGQKPRPEKVAEGDEPSRTTLIPVPADCLDTSGDPMFGRLQERFPPPAPKEGV
jgi:hypothetical protein